MDAPPLPQTLGLSAAARALGIPRATLDRRLRDGTVPYRQLGRRGRRRIRTRDLLLLGASRADILAAAHPATEP